MEERTHPATERQRQRFRERGELPRSRELSSGVIFLAAGGALALAGPQVALTLSGTMQRVFNNVDGGLTPALTDDVARALALAAGPFFLAALAGIVLVGVVQTRGNLSTAKLAPQWERLNLFTRLPQVFFSKDAAISLLIACAKVSAVGAVVWWTLRAELPALLGQAPGSLGAGLGAVTGVLTLLLLRVGLVTLAIGLGEYGLSWYRLEQRMRMTAEEVRRDAKEDHGDPQIRGARRRRARELARQRSLRAVPRADVVLVNPTHYAVALAYRPQVMRAPRVVAKGMDRHAERIRALARASSVPVLEQPPLCRALYRRVTVGREIPADLYHAVAAVLAHVYRLRRRVA